MTVKQAGPINSDIKRITAKKPRSWLRRIGRAVVGLLVGLLVMVLVLIAAGLLLTPDYTRKKTIAGFPVNQIVYLTLDEQTAIFISVWLPPNLKEGETIPTLIRTERYADQIELGWLGKVLETYIGGVDENYKTAGNCSTPASRSYSFSPLDQASRAALAHRSIRRARLRPSDWRSTGSRSSRGRTSGSARTVIRTRRRRRT